MISSKLKHHFIQKKIQKLLTNTTDLRSVGNSKIRSVGILTKEKYYREFSLEEMVADRLELKNSKLYSFRNFNKSEEKSYKHFSEKDFNWRGEIIDSSLKSFVEEPIDLLICFYPKQHSYLEYLTLLSNATFKVGFAGVNSNLFDMEISVDISQTDEFFTELKKYLSILQKL